MNKDENIQIKMSDFDHAFTSRQEGQIMRNQIKELIKKYDPDKRIMISLEGIIAMGPSFTDECFGKLLLEMGTTQFRRKIGFTGANPTIKTLINVVLSRRSKESAATNDSSIT